MGRKEGRSSKKSQSSHMKLFHAEITTEKLATGKFACWETLLEMKILYPNCFSILIFENDQKKKKRPVTDSKPS